MTIAGWVAGTAAGRLARVAAALAIVAAVPLAASPQAAPEPTARTMRPAVDFEAFEEAERTLAFASVGDVVLEARPADVRIVGFHEASFPDALELDPAEDGWEEMTVLPSRARPTPPTSAVDVMLDPDAAPVSPVDGEVVEVREYDLYGDVSDMQVEITPEADPSRTVVVLHVEGVAVDEGEEVAAGQTALGQAARTLPFESQVDRFVDEPAGHLHIEVKNE